VAVWAHFPLITARPAQFVVVLATVASVGIFAVQARYGSSGTPPAPEIAEAIFRYQFLHNASGLQSSATAYCIGYGALGGHSNDGKEPRDAPPQVVAALADVVPPVKAFTQCSHSLRAGVRDNQTHDHALIFTLDSMRCAAPRRCSVEGGYYESGLSASGNTYFLEQRDGKWVVIRDEMHWIS
jgi:hypothetical protein